MRTFRTPWVLMLATLAVALISAPFARAANEGKPAAPAKGAAIPKPSKSGLLAVNGVNYHYQIQGRAALLLHGAGRPQAGVGRIRWARASDHASRKHRSVNPG
jgi:hypothetical protein